MEKICLRTRNSYEILDEERRRDKINELLRKHHSIELNATGIKTLTNITYMTDATYIPPSLKAFENTLNGYADIFRVNDSKQETLWVSMPRKNLISFEERAFYSFLCFIFIIIFIRILSSIGY